MFLAIAKYTFLNLLALLLYVLLKVLTFYVKLVFRIRPICDFLPQCALWPFHINAVSGKLVAEGRKCGIDYSAQVFVSHAFSVGRFQQER